MNRKPKSGRTVVLICSLAGLMSVSCFKKGDGKGSRKFKPSSATVGDVFVPGPGNKPGSPKPSTNPADMDPDAALTLAKCFNIEVSEVAPIVGWNDAATARAAAAALCADLAAANYNGGTIDPLGAPAEID